MPYIKQKDRIRLTKLCDLQAYRHPQTAGELNYVLTKVVQIYFELNGQNYQAINDISGAMTECLAEFRRRIVVPYEDKKIQENGDCY